MTEEEVINILSELQKFYQKEKRDAMTKEYSIYYEGHVNALRVAINKISSQYPKDKKDSLNNDK